MVNGRCPGCDYINPRGDLASIDCILLGCSQMYYIGFFTVLIFISAWALTLSVRYNRQCKSLDSWNGQQDDSTLFLCLLLTGFCLE